MSIDGWQGGHEWPLLVPVAELLGREKQGTSPDGLVVDSGPMTNWSVRDPEWRIECLGIPQFSRCETRAWRGPQPLESGGLWRPSRAIPIPSALYRAIPLKPAQYPSPSFPPRFLPQFRPGGPRPAKPHRSGLACHRPTWFAVNRTPWLVRHQPSDAHRHVQLPCAVGMANVRCSMMSDT